MNDQAANTVENGTVEEQQEFLHNFHNLYKSYGIGYYAAKNQELL